MKGDDIAERLLDFAVRVIKLSEALPKSVVGKHVAGQLVRCGTAAGANYEEGRGAESRADFVHKLGVAWKETRESRFWLRVVHRAQLIKPARIEELLQEAEELSAILSKSIDTARKNAERQGNEQPRTNNEGSTTVPHPSFSVLRCSFLRGGGRTRTVCAVRRI